MGNGEFGIRTTDFNSDTVGGGGGSNINFGDINITTSGFSGDSRKDAEHSKMMAREVKEISALWSARIWSTNPAPVAC